MIIRPVAMVAGLFRVGELQAPIVWSGLRLEAYTGSNSPILSSLTSRV